MNITNTLLLIGTLLFGAKTLLGAGKWVSPADTVFSIIIILSVTWFMVLIWRHQKDVERQRKNEKFKEL